MGSAGEIRGRRRRSSDATTRTSSRRQFFASLGVAAGAAAVLQACGESEAAGETAEFGDGDVGILNYCLSLEHVQAGLYAELVNSGLFRGTEVKRIRELQDEENKHIERLLATIAKEGGKAGKEPATHFQFSDKDKALATTTRLENLFAAAYLGQLGAIEARPTLSTILAIHSIEGRHAVALANLRSKPITPDGAFAKPVAVDAVLAAIEPFMAS